MKPTPAQATLEALEGCGIDSINPVPEDLTCSICHHPAFAGVLTHCEHLFHKKCLQDAWDGGTKNCPMCRESLEGKVSKPMCRPLEAMLSAYKVRCPQACGSEFEWGRLASHVRDDCPNTPFSCSHPGCGAGPMLRAEALLHDAECEHALSTCECSALVKRKDMEAHRANECPFVEVSCDYCSVKGIKRARVAEHLRRECKGHAPMSVVRPMLDRIEQLEQQLGRIEQLEERLEEARKQPQQAPERPAGSVLDFQLVLPAAIDELALDAGGAYRATFNESWELAIFPQGKNKEAAKAGCVSLYLKSSQEAVVKVQVSLGCHVSSFKKFLSAPGSWGWPKFASFASVRHERAVNVVIILNSERKVVEL